MSDACHVVLHWMHDTCCNSPCNGFVETKVYASQSTQRNLSDWAWNCSCLRMMVKSRSPSGKPTLLPIRPNLDLIIPHLNVVTGASSNSESLLMRIIPALRGRGVYGGNGSAFLAFRRSLRILRLTSSGGLNQSGATTLGSIKQGPGG